MPQINATYERTDDVFSKSREQKEVFSSQASHLRKTQSMLFVWSISNMSDEIVAQKMRDIIDNRMTEFSQLFD